ncbi:MAG: hypothetical protein P0Y55_02520 [Candidatus Cohnella colombiensis]|uniref:Uncharacterized protein n=1 Tax=Candidatus Cohnella colombiensis TaxID=3121368 RepID=A0AA95EY71_9BACL|nr:MAG: hypothetical protein P0Y55_02520 [Cohnella sp.]
MAKSVRRSVSTKVPVRDWCAQIVMRELKVFFTFHKWANLL